ncbi:MAG: type VII secretion target [Pseudonocardiaceae bacterium]
MAEQDELYVDPDSMRSAAAAAEGAGAGIAEAGRTATGWIQHAAKAHPGMLSAIALSGALARCSGQLAALGVRTSGVAGKVRQTVAEIEAQDRAAAESLGRPNRPRGREWGAVPAAE